MEHNNANGEHESMDIEQAAVGQDETNDEMKQNKPLEQDSTKSPKDAGANENTPAVPQKTKYEARSILLKRRRVHFDNFAKRHPVAQPKATKPQRFITQRKHFDSGEYLRTKCHNMLDEEEEQNDSNVACQMHAQ